MLALDDRRSGRLRATNNNTNVHCIGGQTPRFGAGACASCHRQWRTGRCVLDNQARVYIGHALQGPQALTHHVDVPRWWFFRTEALPHRAGRATVKVRADGARAVEWRDAEAQGRPGARHPEGLDRTMHEAAKGGPGAARASRVDEDASGY